MNDDYPSSDRFKENEKRIIVTSQKKKNDDRIYKYGFEDLINCLRSKVE